VKITNLTYTSHFFSEDALVVVQAGVTKRTDIIAIAGDTTGSAFAAILRAYMAPFDHIANLDPADVDGATYAALVVGGAGTVVLMSPDGATVTYPGCTAGQIITQDFKRLCTATTATGCVGLQRNLSPVSPVPGGTPIAVAPADVDLIGGPAITVYIGVDGHVVLRAIDGSEATFANMPAGAKLPVRTIRVKAATTAGGILAAY
jgi:hypothetical protein